jgi:hypothetical protein
MSWKHRTEIFRGVSHQSEYIEEKRKEQKKKDNRKRAGIIVAVGMGLRKSFNATARNNQ